MTVSRTTGEDSVSWSRWTITCTLTFIPGSAQGRSRISVIGSAMGILLFLGTLSFLFTTPGVTAGSGFPVLSVLPGQFLLKDLVLVSASLWTLGDSLGAALPRRGAHRGAEHG
jgi:uncharacterized membrane protein YkgB